MEYLVWCIIKRVKISNRNNYKSHMTQEDLNLIHQFLYYAYVSSKQLRNFNNILYHVEYVYNK